MAKGTGLQRREWFIDWFDSPYYHILYKHHDEQEARRFIDLLEAALPIPRGAEILDLGCGKGRFARYLAEKGFHVTGIDISEANIAFARQFENAHLSFYKHDMRRPFRTNYFDCIFNFFTSFGYFEFEKDHIRTLQNVADGLKPKGVFVLDFFNTRKVLKNLPVREVKEVEGIAFHIEKYFDPRRRVIVKEIDFEAEGRHWHFEERVRAFKLEDFKAMFKEVGLYLNRVYGDYELGVYVRRQSDRLILVARKLPQL